MDSVLKNDIYECCVNKHDKMVVDMILLDYSQVEIADYLSISRQRVNRILKDIGFANIDFSNMKYLRYFSDPVFVQTLLQASYDNWNYEAC